MKKVLLILMMFVNFMFANAQNYDTLYIQGMSQGAVFHYCANEYAGVVVYGEPDCNCQWNVNFGGYTYNESIVLLNSEYNYYVTYIGFVSRQFNVFFHTPWEVSPFSEPTLWKRHGESISLRIESIYDLEDYEWIWSNGSNDYEIEVSEPGIYSVTITSIYGCGSTTYSIEVRDNVEIYRAGVDPATNKNRILWQTTPEQATYISSVKIERDGMVVGTVPYTSGQFLDNIGSENAARIYRITGIASDGTECPIPSYQFGTFNTIYSPDIANPSLMNFSWEDPFIEEGSPYEVIAYRIGRVDNTGEFIVIDQLSANVHLGKYNMDLFNGDYGIVAAVFNDSKRDYEELAFSNRSDNEIVGVDEQQIASFKVFPNPTSGAFTVEGTSNLTIYNTMGQVIATSFDENGVHTISIDTPGVYFVSNGEGTVRKIIIQ